MLDAIILIMSTFDINTIIPAVSGIIVVAIGTKVATWNNNLKVFKKEVLELIDEIRQEIGELKLFHIDKDFITEIKYIKTRWINQYDSVISIEFANMMEQNVLAIYNDAETENFTMADYYRIMKLIKAAIKYSNRVSREILKLPKNIDDEIQNVIDKELKVSEKQLKQLAEDNIFNNTKKRLKCIFLEYATNYSDKVVIILATNKI
jgi:hypothetical protein